jgi:hypothetical protein
LDCGPERVVRVPGAREREESRDVANVRVVKGRGFSFSSFWVSGKVLWGRYGSRNGFEEAGKVNVSIVSVEMVLLMCWRIMDVEE